MYLTSWFMRNFFYSNLDNGSVSYSKIKKKMKFNKTSKWFEKKIKLHISLVSYYYCKFSFNSFVLGIIHQQFMPQQQTKIDIIDF